MLLAALGFLMKCTAPNDSDEVRKAASLQESAEACTILGTWSRCISNGTASARITFIATEDLISQKTDTFLSNALCEGAPDGESIADLHYQAGPSGASSFIRGGTDLDLTSMTDLGCGADKTVYSVIKFSEDCSQFYPVQMQPGCKPTERGLILDTVPFQRQ